MKKKDCRSVIQWDFDECLDHSGYCVHHVFPGNNRWKSEKYGFLVCIPVKLHEEAHKHINQGMSLQWKKDCQRWYEENVGERDDFITEFGRNYLDE